MADNVSNDAAKPKKVTVDGQTVERHDLEDQIAAQRHTNQSAAAKQSHFGIRLGRLRNQGTQS